MGTSNAHSGNLTVDLCTRALQAARVTRAENGGLLGSNESSSKAVRWVQKSSIVVQISSGIDECAGRIHSMTSRRLRSLFISMAAIVATLMAGIVSAPSANAYVINGTRFGITAEQAGPYVANLCFKNISQNNIESCTGNIPQGTQRWLEVPWRYGDVLQFIVAVRWGHNSYYTWTDYASTVYWCKAYGTSLSPGSNCYW